MSFDESIAHRTKQNESRAPYEKGERSSNLPKEIIVAKEASIENLPDRISSNPGNPYYNMWYNEKGTYLPQFQGSKKLKTIVFFAANNGSVRVDVTHGNGEKISKDFSFVAGKNTLNLDWQLYDYVTDFSMGILTGTLCANKSGVQPELGKIWYRWDRWNDGLIRDWSLGLGIYLEDVLPDVPKDGELTPIWIHEYQHSQNITGENKFHHTLIENSE